MKINPKKRPLKSFARFDRVITPVLAAFICSVALLANGFPQRRPYPVVHTFPHRSAVLPNGIVSRARSAERSFDRQAGETFANLPVSFQPIDSGSEPARFRSRDGNYDFQVSSSEAVLHLGAREDKVGYSLHMKLAGAKPDATAVGIDRLPGQINYFIGNKPDNWRRNVPSYSRIKYDGIYPGIDLIYHGNKGEMEYDLALSPYADPASINLLFEGAEHISIDKKGDLLLRTKLGVIRQRKPVTYQETKHGRRKIASHYVLLSQSENNSTKSANQSAGELPVVAFKLGPYDTTRAIVIDPSLSYSALQAGTEDDLGMGIAIDSDGNAYVTGYTFSSDLPVVNPAQGNNHGSSDVFVTKVDAKSNFVYTTYLGGSDFDSGMGIAVDADKNVYITGYTASADFPLINPLQLGNDGETDAFVLKLNASGNTLLYASYLGGGGNDAGTGIAVSPAGNAFVTGYTFSANFPTQVALQNVNHGGSDSFVSEISAQGNALIYSTYLGGSSDEQSNAIALDNAGNAYITGSTSSSDFPLSNALQTAFLGSSDAFVSKINSSGSALIYSTYLGGNDVDIGNGIAVDGDENAYVTGLTRSVDFPTMKPLKAGMTGTADAFVARLNSAGTALLFSTYLGGGDYEAAEGISLDPEGNVYIVGMTQSTDFPSILASQRFFGGASDAFVSKLSGDGTSLGYSTLIGGQFGDQGRSIAVSTAANAYVTGHTVSADFPTSNSVTPLHHGAADAFIVKLLPFVSGDLSGEGNINVSDLFVLANMLAGNITITPELKQKADVLQDGKINVQDLLILANYLAGNVKHLPLIPSN